MINENYKVSILTPVYNVSNYIERCARSLFEQTYDNLEFILSTTVRQTTAWRFFLV